MSNFIFLVNPVSGTVRKAGVIDLIKQQASASGSAAEIVETRPDGNYDHLLSKIAGDGSTRVIIVGGDGTVNQAVNGLRNTVADFGIIPMGSGNGLAYAAGIPRQPALALKLAFSGQSKPVDGFLVNGQFSCMLTGLGFDAQVAHDFANKASRGLMTYTRQTLIQYFRAGTYPFELAVGDFHFSTNAYFISIANSNQFGNRVTIAPQASLSDGLLDIVVVQKMNKALLPFAVLRQLRGTNRMQVLAAEALKKNIIYFQSSSIKITNPGRAPLHIDGEPKETAGSYQISVLPGCFRLIQP
ncbi:MAG TPA: YegS/Rv2252/BmrU family lipid kinase [Chitinophagaceae bacterium]